MARRTVLAAALASAVALSACGGGGAGSPPPTRPATTTQSPPTSTVNGGGGQAVSVAVALPPAGVPTIYTASSSGSDAEIHSWTEQPAPVASVVASSVAFSRTTVATSRDGQTVYAVTTEDTTGPECHQCSPNFKDTLKTYDPQTLALRSSDVVVPFDDYPMERLLAGADGKLYGLRAMVLYQIDPAAPTATRSAAPAKVGGVGKDFALSGDASRAYLNLTNVTGGYGNSGQVVAIDTATMQQAWATTIPARVAADTGIALANYGTEIFAAGAGTIVVLSTSGAIRAQIPIADQASPAILDVPGAAGCNGDGIYVAEADTGNIAIIDSGAMRITKTIPSGVAHPSRLARTPDGKLVVGGSDQLAVFADVLNPTAPNTVSAPGITEIATRAAP